MLYSYMTVMTVGVIRTYLGQILIREEMKLPRLEAVLTFTLIEEVGLEFPTGVFFCGRHDHSTFN